MGVISATNQRLSIHLSFSVYDSKETWISRCPGSGEHRKSQTGGDGQALSQFLLRGDALCPDSLEQLAVGRRTEDYEMKLILHDLRNGDNPC